MIEEDKLFEEMWKLSVQKFEAKFGPLTEAEGADIGKPFMYEAWKEVVVPYLSPNICEDPDYDSECICGDPDCCSR
jgi:hypothetical protein